MAKYKNIRQKNRAGILIQRQNKHKTLNKKQGQTLGETQEIPKETGKTLCETRGNGRGNGETCGKYYLRGFLSHQFLSSFIYRRNNPRILGNLHCVSPHIFLCKPIGNFSMHQDGRGTGCRLDVLDIRTCQLCCRSQLWVMESHKVGSLSE